MLTICQKTIPLQKISGGGARKYFHKKRFINKVIKMTKKLTARQVKFLNKVIKIALPNKPRKQKNTAFHNFDL